MRHDRSSGQEFTGAVGFYAVATIRPEVGWQANVSFTSFRRMTHGHNPASHLDPTINRRIAELAVQFRLGLLSNGRARTDFSNCPNSRLVGKDLR
jgi:hypothetical protein